MADLEILGHVTALEHATVLLWANFLKAHDAGDQLERVSHDSLAALANGRDRASAEARPLWESALKHQTTFWKLVAEQVPQRGD